MNALTTKEVAKVLQMNQQTIRNAANAGEIPCIRIGRRMSFSPLWIDKIFKEGLTACTQKKKA